VIRALLLVASLVFGAASAARATPCPECVLAGAATVSLAPPSGAPLAGYGSLVRRLLFPGVLGQYPYAFWFKPSEGTLDSLFARAIVVESGEARVAWATVDLVAVDRSFTQEVGERLRAAGLPPASLVISASHTHSGPGAFVHSRLWALLAVDRFNTAVRSALVSAVVQAITRAEAAKVPARVAAFVREAPDVTTGRLGLPVDREIVGLRFLDADGQPLALLWNYAIHGTMLGPANLRFSGDVMGLASEWLEGELRAPVLFVNGAVGDVSPRRHGQGAAREVAAELVAALREGWREGRELGAATIVTRAMRLSLPAPYVSLRNCLGPMVPRALTLPLGWAMPRDAELLAIALGDVVWVVVPGELQSALGREIKEAARARFGLGFVAGVSNDYLGYLITPEAYDTRTYVGCATLYGPTAGERVARAARALIEELGEGRGAAER
jgi:Neutral/alkaline non-lysosomal ceramidase, N-terminal